MDLDLAEQVVLVSGAVQGLGKDLGRPSDVAPLVLLLASPLSGWTTGQVVSVNGGYSMA